MKLLITGGHVTPALAVIDELQKTHPEVKIIFVGRKQAYAHDQLTMEYQEVTKRNIPFIHLNAGRLTRVLSLKSIKNALQTPFGFWSAYTILQKEKPDKILSFGGYLALPIALVASWLHIPVYTHEQTIHPGSSNRLVGRIAKRVFISFEDSKQYFDVKKVLLTGNPIRKDVLKHTTGSVSLPADRPVLYITGGSLGSHSLNEHIEHLLPKLLEKYTVIHQTGNVKEYNDFERLSKMKDALSQEQQDYYIVKEHILSDDIGKVFSKADLIIGRAGANTFFEVLYLKKPVLFIPLPWAAFNEQEKQAQLTKKWGVGEVFHQNQSSEELYSLIEKMMNHLQDYKAHYEQLPRAYSHEAAKAIISEVLS